MCELERDLAMTTPMNFFVTEGNVDIYLSKLLGTFDRASRDNLFRLLTDELSRMELTRAHLDNGERRVVDINGRIRWQREEIERLKQATLPTDASTLLLETLEQTQMLLEAHCQRLRAACGPHQA